MNLLNQKEAQTICDQWADLFRIGSWKFTVELKDNGATRFRYNCNTGNVVFEILYKDATQQRIIQMFVDFSLIHTLLPRVIEGGDQYIDHDDRLLSHIITALWKLSGKQEKVFIDDEGTAKPDGTGEGNG